MPTRRAVSIRAHILAIVVLGAVLPLALIGFWLTRSAVRSGRALLANQLQTSLANVTHSIALKWEDRRGTLLLLADNQVTRDAMARGSFTPADSEFLASGGGGMGSQFATIVYRDTAGRRLFATSGRPASSGQRGPAIDTSRWLGHGTFQVSYPIRDGFTVLGTLEADVLVDAVLPSDSARLLLPGSSLAVRDRLRGIELLHLLGVAPFPSTNLVPIDGSSWMVRTANLADPRLDIAVGSPIAPYVTPFARDGRISLIALLGVALIAVLLTGFFTSRLAGSVAALVETTGAVAGGDLSRRAAPTGPSEFRTLADSFNAMTESLRQLISELSERRALAAVGEFAAALAHEVRNALTAIQIDLERVDERTEDTKNRALIDRTLIHVRRLDAAVTGSLRIARSGTIVAQQVILKDVLAEAIQNAEPSFASAGTCVMMVTADAAVGVNGDGEALQQLFLNLLLNAQQALAPGGRASVAIRLTDDQAIVSIADSGSGMTAEQLGRAFDLHYTTRATGTGLGLPIARQIAIAHGGDLKICSTPGVGTTVEVRLPATDPGRSSSQPAAT